VGDNNVLHALQVVVTEDDHTFTLKVEDLERLLLDPRVKNNKVIVLSVAGAFRKGKSFLLDFFLRYLYAKVTIISFTHLRMLFRYTLTLYALIMFRRSSAVLSVLRFDRHPNEGSFGAPF